MQNKETYDEIFNPKPVELLIGDNDSNVFACGKNYNTELTFKGYRYLTHPSGLSLNRKYKIIDVSAGNEHTALLTELGYVFVFGSTLHNKLGLEGTTVVNIGSPKLLPLSEQEQITKVVCGPFHTLALTSQDQVWGWGGTLHKKTGTRDSRPSVVYGFDKVQIVKIGCGDYHSVALSNQGILFSWGGGGPEKNRGQTGHGIYDDIQYPRPISHFQNSPVHDFECGGYHTISIQQDGFVFSWGQGLNGQLGHGDYKDSSLPKQIKFEEQVVIESIACGGKHSFFKTKDGLLYSCGHGAHGQTGQKLQDDLFHPTLVKSLQKKFVEKIVCGQSHSIALVNPNFVYSCGLNDYGQLGLGDLDKRFKFTFVEKLASKNVTRIRAGGHHSWFIIDYDNPLVENYQPPSPCYSSPAMSQVNQTTEVKKFPKGLYKQFDKTQQRDKLNNSVNVLVPRNNKKPSITLSKSEYSDLQKNKKSDDSLLQKNNLIQSNNIDINEPDISDDDLLIDNDIPPNDIVDIKDQKNVFQNSVDEIESKDEDINLLQSAKFDGFSQSRKDNKTKKNDKVTGDKNPPQKNNKIKRPKSNNFLKRSNLQQSNRDQKNESFFKKANTSINKFIPDGNKKKPQVIKKNTNNKPLQNNLLQPTGSIKFGKHSTFGSNPQSPKDLNEKTIIRLPVDKQIPNYQTKEQHDVVHKKKKIWSLSVYYLLFVDLDYNHKYILLNFKQDQEELLIKKVEKSIGLIRKHDPNLLKYYFVKYQDYWVQTDDNLLKKIMSCCKTNEGVQLTDQTYVLMLVQESNLFKQLTRRQNLQSNYRDLDYQESSLSDVYMMWPDNIERDMKWKLLSRSYEIILDQVFDCIHSFTIYELRSNFYYQQINIIKSQLKNYQQILTKIDPKKNEVFENPKPLQAGSKNSFDIQQFNYPQFDQHPLRELQPLCY